MQNIFNIIINNIDKIIVAATSIIGTAVVNHFFVNRSKHRQDKKEFIIQSGLQVHIQKILNEHEFNKIKNLSNSYEWFEVSMTLLGDERELKNHLNVNFYPIDIDEANFSANQLVIEVSNKTDVDVELMYLFDSSKNHMPCNHRILSNKSIRLLILNNVQIDGLMLDFNSMKVTYPIRKVTGYINPIV